MDSKKCDPGWFKCDSCNIEYTNENEYIFHTNVKCPKRTKTIYYMTVCHGASKKRSACYRCGRIGHYYRKKECYAIEDVDGNVITWGEARKLDRKNPQKKVGTYSSV